MHPLDIIVVCLVVVLGLVLIGTIARQRYMLHSGGAIPLAVQRHDSRWTYGVGRYVGGDLRWYRMIGIGSRPTRAWSRSGLRMQRHRPPEGHELAQLPANAVIVECAYGADALALAFGESAFTGFVSWLEASSPAT